jgi:hypothetical protein
MFASSLQSLPLDAQLKVLTNLDIGFDKAWENNPK